MKIEDTLREPENMRKVQKLTVQRTTLHETHPDFILSDFVQPEMDKTGRNGVPPYLAQMTE